MLVVRRIIKEVPMPDRIRTLINKWGKQGMGENYMNHIEFLDRHNNPVQWETKN